MLQLAKNVWASCVIAQCLQQSFSNLDGKWLANTTIMVVNINAMAKSRDRQLPVSLIV
jgi:hypothetical protein